MFEVLGLHEEHPIIKALKKEKIDSMMEISSLIQYVDTLDYEVSVTNEEGGTETQMQELSKSEKGYLKILLSFMRYKEMSTYDDCESLEKRDFDEYRTIIYDPTSEHQHQPTMTRSLPRNNHKSSEAEMFMKSIKKDRTAYPTLKEDRQWDKWNRSLKAVARTHGCEIILDPSYVPGNEGEIELFKEKQKFMYSVFEDKVLTNTGLTLVRKYEENFDAQNIYRGLLKHSKESTQANIDTAELLTYITSVKLHKITWKGTYYDFILHWCDKVRLYEQMVSHKDHFTLKVKKIMLQNTVAGIPSLRHVKTQSDHDRAHGRGELSFENYRTLLLSAASTHDSITGFTSRSKYRTYQSSRNSNVYSTNVHYSDYEDETSYGVDTGCIFEDETEHYNLNETNMTYTRPPINGPKMSRDQWLSLSKQEQLAWDTISGKSKAIILRLAAPQPRQQQDGKVQERRNYLHQRSMNDSKNYENSINKNELESKPDNTDYGINEHNAYAFLTDQTHPGDIRNVLSTSKSKGNSKQENHNPKEERILKNLEISYVVSNTTSSKKGSLIDRGANGGLAGKDVRIICHHDPPKYIDVSGINNHKVENLPVVTVGGVAPSNRGPVIVIMHQYAYLGKGSSIHSCVQLESYKLKVDDKAISHGGTQTIETIDGYTHPLDFNNGLPYIPLRPYTDEEWTKLPHVIWTSDTNWVPSKIDKQLTNDPGWPNSIPNNPNDNNDRLYDETGNINQIGVTRMNSTIKVHKKEMDTELIKPNLLYVDDEVIRRTLQNTTQFYRTRSDPFQLKQTYRTPFPACNVQRRNEAVATDTIFSSTPAIDNGSKLAQIYIGRESLITDIYPIRNEKQFVSTLQDNIRKRGAMNTLISDRAKVEISKQCHDILRAYCIKDWQSEPHYQHQNHAERRYSKIKPLVNRLLNTTGAPPDTWLLALEHVARILNHTATKSLDWKSPLQAMYGYKPDISAILLFRFWEKIYYKNIDARFSTTRQRSLGGLWESQITSGMP